MVAAADPTLAAFLAGSMVAHVTTVSPAGRPFLTPLWFVVDAGTMYLATGLETRAARNVVSHPDVSVLLIGEAMAPAGAVLRVRGTATRHAGLPPWRVLLRIAAKYYLGPDALRTELANVTRWRLRLRYYAQAEGGAGHLRIVPTRTDLVRRP